MSQYFQVGDTVLWNPSTGVAQLFARSVEAVAPLVDAPTGVGPDVSDEYQIDLAEFTAFINRVVDRYRGSNHQQLRALIEGVAGIGIAMIESAGGTVTSLGSGRLALDGAVRLREVADQASRSMVR
jgi:hypothetical protein